MLHYSFPVIDRRSGGLSKILLGRHYYWLLDQMLSSFDGSTFELSMAVLACCFEAASGYSDCDFSRPLAQQRRYSSSLHRLAVACSYETSTDLRLPSYWALDSLIGSSWRQCFLGADSPSVVWPLVIFYSHSIH